MKRTLLTLATVVLVAGLSGCVSNRMHQAQRGGPGLLRGSCKAAPDVCRSCRPGRRGSGAQAFNPGPPIGSVAYPYYTIRGPRDFLASDPPSIGP